MSDSSAPEIITVSPDVALDDAGFWKKLRRFAGKLPFSKDLAAAYAAMIDVKTPIWAKVAITSALVYFLAPVDAVPEAFLGMAGFADDAAVLMTALKLVGDHVTLEHRQQAERWLS